MDGVGSRLAGAVAVQPDIDETSYMERVWETQRYDHDPWNSIVETKSRRGDSFTRLTFTYLWHQGRIISRTEHE